MNLPAFRAPQIWRWLYAQRIRDWARMKNIPASLRTDLASRFLLDAVTCAEVKGQDAGPRKILARLPDGEAVEAVLLPSFDGRRRTVCVSSQAGCKFHCAFCASGQAGFGRNLGAGEIVGQVLLASDAFGENPSNVVFMGIGEPFDNYDRVLKAIRILNDPDGLAIGARKITISTCGVIPGIRRLAEEGLQVELSVSLHAPDNALRTRLMPVSKTYPLEALLEACREYFERTRRLITFEYTLIRGVNDSVEHARALVRRIRPLTCRVNLIPLSRVDEFPCEGSTPDAARMFIETLARAGINATLRDSMGSTLKAACGQLRYAGRQTPAKGDAPA